MSRSLELLQRFGPIVRTELARRSLHEFVKQAWPILEPGQAFVDGWHIRGICRHLEAVSNNEIRDLLINVPPGCMKTLLTSVFWPCWLWATRPDTRWMFASYNGDLSERDSLRRRKLLTSAWYRDAWNVKLLSGENRKMRFHNSARGWMLATSVNGQATGEHPDFIVVDDPLNGLQAESEVHRHTVLDWWDNTIASRGVVRDVKRVVVMHRLHRCDLSGHLLKKGGFVQICLPMEYEGPSRMPATPLDWVDERTEMGELLWPTLFPHEVVARLKQDQSPGTQAGQLQQRPPEQDQGAEFPAGYFGDSIWFEDWPDKSLVRQRVMALDPSMGNGEVSDFSAIVLMVIDLAGTCWIEAHLERLDSTRLVVRAAELAGSFDPTHCGLEINGFQQLLVAPLMEGFTNRGLRIDLVSLTNNFPKLSRIRRLSGPLARGQFRFRRTRGTDMLVEQLRAFPTAIYDDGPDALEGALQVWSCVLRNEERDED